MLTVLAACSNNEVTVDGNITNLGNTNLRVAYCVGADRVADKIVGCQADHFQFKCQVDELSLIVIYNVQGGIVARFVADGGDDITITGDKNKPREFKITGNKINEQWCQFMSDHKVEYQASDPAKLDEAIVKWVNENPRDITSTLLLLNDYSNRDGQLAQAHEAVLGERRHQPAQRGRRRPVAHHLLGQPLGQPATQNHRHARKRQRAETKRATGRCLPRKRHQRLEKHLEK